jgi:hypothetical protein
MTPERKASLVELMEDLTHREIKRLVAEFQSGAAEAAPISERLAALGEITACIHTAFSVLSGEVFAKVIARKSGLPRGACGPPKHEEGQS